MGPPPSLEVNIEVDPPPEVNMEVDPPEVNMEVEPPWNEHGSGPLPPPGWTSQGAPSPLWMDQPGYPPPQTYHTSAIHQLASGQFSFEKRISTC